MRSTGPHQPSDQKQGKSGKSIKMSENECKQTKADESSWKWVENEWLGSETCFWAWPLIFSWFSTTFICFHLFLTIFTYSLSILLNDFWLSLFVFNCFKPNSSIYLKTYFYLFLCYFSIIFIHFCYIWQNSFTSLAMFSNRVRSGQVR